MRLFSLFTCCFLFAAACALAAPQPAHFAFGKEVPISTHRIGPKGATLTISNTGTALDGMVITVPAKALKQDTDITLAYDTGALTLNTGTPAGAALRIRAGGLKQFEQPLHLEVDYDNVRWPRAVLIGFAIDANGLLSPVQTLRKQPAQGKWYFDTFVPMLFTWVYAPV